MARTLPTSMRLDPKIEAALNRAAKDDGRSVSSFVERILKAWLAKRGYLANAEEKPR